jgi:hypothetical protein
MTGRRYSSRMVRVVTSGAVVLALYRFVLRSRQLRWGATDEEVADTMPGDDLLVHSDLTATRAITIRRGPDGVWPWIAQLGQGRGGFYSYDALENLVGLTIHSADGIVREWQEVRAGDEVRLAPEVKLQVAAADPGHALVLRGGIPMGSTPPPYDFTWAFVLHDQADGTTRLLVRERYRYTKQWAPLIVEPAAMMSFVMSHKMLRGIRDRAEEHSSVDAAAMRVG